MVSGEDDPHGGLHRLFVNVYSWVICVHHRILSVLGGWHDTQEKSQNGSQWRAQVTKYRTYQRKV